MAAEVLKGFVLAQDRVHGEMMWKVRVRQPGHHLDGKKCRVVGVAGNYVPTQSADVEFVVSTKAEGGNTVYLAHDVRPASVTSAKKSVEKPKPTTDDLCLVFSRTDGKLHVSYFAADAIDEAREEMEAGGEEFLGFFSFDITQHVGPWDDSDVADAFGMIEALFSLAATTQALEKLLSAVANETLKLKV